MIPSIPPALSEYFIEGKGWNSSVIWLMWQELRDLWPQMNEKTTVIFNQYPSSFPFRMAVPVAVKIGTFQPVKHPVPAEGLKAFLWRLIPDVSRNKWWWRGGWRSTVRVKLRALHLRGYRDYVTYTSQPERLIGPAVQEYPWKWYTVRQPVYDPMIPVPMYSLAVCYVAGMDALLINTGENSI